jgi:hypothetical protein
MPHISELFSKLRARTRVAGYRLAIHINRSTDPTIILVGTVAAANHLPALTLVVVTGVAGHG